jgi:hypothetical protein
MNTYFKAIGVTFTLLIAIAFTLLAMYLSYLLGLAALIFTVGFIVYQVIKLLDTSKLA